MVGATVVLSALLTLGTVAASEYDFGGHGTDSSFLVEGLARELGRDSGASYTSTDGAGAAFELIRAPACANSSSRVALDPVCPNNERWVETCLDGTPATEPVWIRREQADGTWSEWTALSWYSCDNDAILLAAIQREWSQLQPDPSVINLQPGNGWVIATVPTIAMAQDAPRLHATTLLGAGVEIRATASGYVWQWGDGARTETTDPGRPYPDATVTHTYAHASGDARVALTTTWTGEYRVNGGPWVSFDSTIESAAAPVTLAVHDPRSRLVDCDVTDRCRLVASG